MSLIVCVCLVLASAATIVTADWPCRPIEISGCSKLGEIANFNLRINVDSSIEGTMEMLPAVNSINDANLTVTSQCNVHRFVFRRDVSSGRYNVCDKTPSKEPMLIDNLMNKIQGGCPLKSGLTTVKNVLLNPVKENPYLRTGDRMQCRFGMKYGELLDCLSLTCIIEEQSWFGSRFW